MGMTDSVVVRFDVPMRVAVAVSPPLLAELLRRVIGDAGMDVGATSSARADVALILDADADDLDANATITLDTSARQAVVVDRVGYRREVNVGGPTDIIDLIREIVRR